MGRKKRDRRPKRRSSGGAIRPRVGRGTVARSADLYLPAGKLSDALVEVVQPILSRPDMPRNPESLRTALLLAAVAWNAGRTGDPAEEREMLRELAGGLASGFDFPRVRRRKWSTSWPGGPGSCIHTIRAA